MLLRKQHNSLLEILKDAGLPTQEFSDERYESHYIVYYNGNDRAFSFEILPGGRGMYNVELSPGINSLRESYSTDGWDGVQKLFVQWAANLKDEIETPDLWATAATQVAAADAPFTADEAKRLQKQLTALQTEVGTLALTVAQQAIVRQVLADESKTLDALPGKKSWMKTLGSKISDGLATTATSPETLATIAKWIYKALIEAVPELAAIVEAARHLLG